MHDLLQFVVDRPGCCYRTCLSVRLRGKRLDNFSDLGAVEGLRNGDTVELVEGEGVEGEGVEDEGVEDEGMEDEGGIS